MKKGLRRKIFTSYSPNLLFLSSNSLIAFIKSFDVKSGNKISKKINSEYAD